jgi:ferredoxin-NADP reductase
LALAAESVSERNSLILQLARVERQTRDAKTLRFLVPQGKRVLFRPGQFLTFNWLIDGQSVPRCYSICSSPTQAGYIEITPKQMANGYVSVFLNQKASMGSTVAVSQPSGQFYFDEQEHQRIVMIAGGSGITPFMSMLRYIDDRCLATKVTLLYFVRTRNDIIFESELNLLRAQLRRFHLVTVLSEPDPLWLGASGHLTRDLIDVNVEDIPASTFFLCGPSGLMKAAHELLESMGVSPARIKRENFATGLAGTLVRQSSASQMMMVEFARSKQIQMASSSATLLETAEACGIRLPYSCRQGQCGTCVTKLLKGHVQMDSEDGLTAELKERGYILPCVSHACSDLKIDA